MKSTTLEIFQSFGIGDAVWAEAWRLEEIAIWKTDGSTIERTDIVVNKVEELGKVREVMLQQERVEDLLYQNLRDSLESRRMTFEYGTVPLAITKLEDALEFPLRVSHGPHVPKNALTAQDEMNVKSVGQYRAQYVVGCDGAHSWTRRRLAIEMRGDQTDSIFGVMDIVPDTDFPDIRKVCYLQGPEGTILAVPRSNREVRMYVPLPSKAQSSERPDYTAEEILHAVKLIIKPYRLAVLKYAWVSSYRVRQQVGQRFSASLKSKASGGVSSDRDRIFLAGDAVHTHSPKAGQGMNTGIQDANNLGWKLRLVLEGRISSQVLDTYHTERKPVAEELIQFDRKYVKLFTDRSTSFKQEMLSAMKFTTGLATQYPQSLVVWPDKSTRRSTAWTTTDNAASQDEAVYEDLQRRLKADLVPGKRLPDFQVVCQADGIATFIHQRLTANGSFRILYFPGDISNEAQASKLAANAAWMDDPAKGMRKHFMRNGFDNALVEAFVVHSAPRLDIELQQLHPLFVPFEEGRGRDYWRVYADDVSIHEGHGRAYTRLDIDPARGLTVVVRPDGYIGLVTDLEDFTSVLGYFQAIVEGKST